MAIISVRVSNDIPVQSEYLPLISLYFFLSLLYAFASFLWFTFLEYAKSQKKIEKHFNHFLIFIKSFYNKKSNNRVYNSNDENQSNIIYIETIIKMMNNFAFFIMLLSMLSSYLFIWISISL